MLWRAGAVVAEGWWWPYQSTLRHMMHSATKSFLSAGIGLAIAEGRFGLDDRVLSFFPEHAPPAPSANLAAMTVGDLLTQTCGHAHGTSGALWRQIPTSWIAEFFKIGVPLQPGSVFRYTSATSFMLSAIITRTTGQSLHEYLKPRLFAPLGIDDLAWDMGPENINPGGNGISARTADLLKLAVLHHQGGAWQGRQLLPMDWVKAATAPQRGNPYGYHWWAGPRGSFYAYGVFGQFAFVFPDQDAILVTTAATPYGEETLRSVVWNHFPALLEKPVLADPFRDEEALRERTGQLRILPVFKPARSSLEQHVSGLVFDAEPNEDGVEWIRLNFTGDRCLFSLNDRKGEHHVVVGLADWIEGETSISGARLHHGYEPDVMRVVAGGRWVTPERFEMIWQFNETAFRDTVTIAFEDSRSLTLERRVNTNSGLAVRPGIVAKRRS
jgi:hypothetical protein